MRLVLSHNYDAPGKYKNITKKCIYMWIYWVIQIYEFNLLILHFAMIQIITSQSHSTGNAHMMKRLYFFTFV